MHPRTPASATMGMRFLARLVLWMFVLLVALSNLGVDITALVAGLGIGGIAVALALQNILSDILRLSVHPRRRAVRHRRFSGGG